MKEGKWRFFATLEFHSPAPARMLLSPVGQDQALGSRAQAGRWPGDGRASWPRARPQVASCPRSRRKTPARVPDLRPLTPHPPQLARVNKLPPQGRQPLTCRAVATLPHRLVPDPAAPARPRPPAAPQRPPQSPRPQPRRPPPVLASLKWEQRPPRGRTPPPPSALGGHGRAPRPQSMPRAPAAAAAAAPVPAAPGGWRAPSAARPARRHGGAATGVCLSRRSELSPRQRRARDPTAAPTAWTASRVPLATSQPGLCRCHLSDSLSRTSPIEQTFRASALSLAAAAATLCSQAGLVGEGGLSLVVNIAPTNQIVIASFEARPSSGRNYQ